MARIPGISPYGQHNTILSTHTYRNLAEKRERFQNDVQEPDVNSAVEYLDTTWAIYRLAQLVAEASNLKSPEIPTSADALSREALAWFQWLRPDYRGRQTEDEVRSHLDHFLGGHLALPFVDAETTQFTRSLRPVERYKLLDTYYRAEAASAWLKRQAASTFIGRQIKWRGKEAFNACQSLDFFAHALQRLSPTDLQKLEARYHVASLPPYPALTLIGGRATRIAICVASVISVTQHSMVFRLDRIQADHVARKYHAFLEASKAAASGRRKTRPSKDLIFRHYLKIIR